MWLILVNSYIIVSSYACFINKLFLTLNIKRDNSINILCPTMGNIDIY